MVERKLIEIKIYLTCDDKGLNRDNVAAGYVKNLEKMHAEEYISEDNKGNTIERVQLFAVHTKHGGNIVTYQK